MAHMPPKKYNDEIEYRVLAQDPHKIHVLFNHVNGMGQANLPQGFLPQLEAARDAVRPLLAAELNADPNLGCRNIYTNYNINPGGTVLTVFLNNANLTLAGANMEIGKAMEAVMARLNPGTAVPDADVDTPIIVGLRTHVEWP